MKPEEKTIYTVVYMDYQDHVAEADVYSSHEKAVKAVEKILNDYETTQGNQCYVHHTEDDRWDLETIDGGAEITIQKDKVKLNKNDTIVYVLSTARFDDRSIKAGIYTSFDNAEKVGEEVKSDLKADYDDLNAKDFGNIADLYDDGSLKGWIAVKQQPIM